MGSTISNGNPWAGLASYEDSEKVLREGREQKQFCGREEEIDDVTHLITNNIFVTLYGKSGTGKTSLLNAGVFPHLREKRYLPVSIRLSIDAANCSFQQSIIDKTKEAIKLKEGNTQTFDFVPLPEDPLQPNYLWSYFARTRFFVKSEDALSQYAVFPVIGLDQFEEVLRDRKAETEALLRQIAYLMDESHALAPRYVGDVWYEYDFNFRFVISIREDALYRLEDSIDNNYLSELKRCRYRLRSLSEHGAMDAILIPGEDCIEKEERNGVAKQIIKLATPNEEGDIDTLLLSLICARTYDNKQGEKIKMDDLCRIWKDNKGEWIKNVMEVYYQDAIRGLASDKVRYLQECLIYADGTRKHADVEEVKNALGGDYQRLMEDKTQILHDVGQNQVELLHDQLGMAVFEDRRAFEEREKKRKRTCIVVASFIAFIVMAWVAVWMYMERQRALMANWKTMEIQSRFVAEKAVSLAGEDSYLATLLAVNVLPEKLASRHPSKPYTPEAERALRFLTNHNPFVLHGHNSFVKSVSFDTIGDRVATASWDRTIIIWDFKTGKVIHRLIGHEGYVNFVAFSPNGDYLASASSDKTIRIWNAKSGKIIDTLRGHSGYVNSVSYSPDGNRLVSASSDQSLIIWDVDTKKMIARLTGHNGSVVSAVFSPNGERIASASRDKTIKIWDGYGETQFAIHTFTAHLGNVVSVAYSPNGSKIVSASYDRTVMIWDTVGHVIHTLIGHDDSVNSVFFSHDGGSVVSASCDKTIRIWDTTGQVMDTLIGHNERVNSAIFSPKDDFIISVSNDRTIRLWKLIQVQKILPIENRSNYTRELIYSPNSKLIVAPSIDKSLKVWNSDTRKITCVLTGHSDQITSASFSLDGTRIATASRDKTIRIWDTTGQILDTFIGHSDYVSSVAFSPNGKLIVSASWDKTIKIWGVESRKEIQTIPGHKKAINCVLYSPDGKYILSASDDCTIKMWDSNNGELVRTFHEHTNVVNTITFNPNNSKEFISTSYDKTIKVWNIDKESSVFTFCEHSNYFNGASFSLDGKYIISTDQSQNMIIWDAETKQVIQKMPTKAYHAIFGPDSNHILICQFPQGIIGLIPFSPLQDLIDQTYERFKDRPLTVEERRMYYLE